jgi:hypothetical protein
MSLLNKLFRKNSDPDNPDNTKLIGLLEIYWKSNGAGDSYKNVVLELMNGNSFLIFPTQNNTITMTDAVQDVLEDVKLDQPLDIMFIEDASA